jgi:ribulose kinase
MSASTGGDEAYLLGIDFGTESCRAGLVDSGGHLVAAEATTYDLVHPRPWLLWLKEREPAPIAGRSTSSMPQTGRRCG